MRQKPRLLSFLSGIALLVSLPSAVLSNAAKGHEFVIEPIVTGLETPWAIAPLGQDHVLITERDGALLYYDGTGLTSVSGVPDVVARGQGGLLDITLARDFHETRVLFLTYAKPQSQGSGTALISATLSEDNGRLENVTELFEMKPGSTGGRHFGSRVVEAADGRLFMTIGDRGDRPSAQDLATHNGTVVRVNRDGSVPGDNPFVGHDDALPEIWSYGHRNPQGAGLDLDGILWVSEHGARGGDEVNTIAKGVNYGWPVISYGRHYSGGKIGEGTAKEGMAQPTYYWDPSMAPSGLMIYSGALFPEWTGDIFVGSLKFSYIARLEGTPMKEVQQIKTPQTDRVRDIVEGPEGAIWFLSVGNGTVYRMRPNDD